LKYLFKNDDTWLPESAKMVGEVGYYRPTIVPRKVFEGLIAVWEHKDFNPGSVSEAVILAAKLGHKETADWIKTNDFKYGEALYHGIVIKGVSISLEPTKASEVMSTTTQKESKEIWSDAFVPF